MTNTVGTITSYDFLNSSIKIDEYIKFAKDNLFSCIFYAEEAGMYGFKEFYNKSIKNNIKPIIGIKLSFIDVVIYFYIKNYQGYLECIKLSSEFTNNNSYKNESINKYIKIFNNNYKNLIIVICGQKKIIENLIANKNMNKNIFIGVNKTNREFDNNQNVLFVNESKFFDDEGEYVYRAIKAINENKFYSDIKLNDECRYPNDNKISDVIDLKKHNETIEKISKLINENIFENKSWHFITYQNFDPKDKIKQICLINLDIFIKNKLIDENKKQIYLNRFNYELDVISDLKFCEYFLVVADFINYSKKQNIMIGPGRGSAAGSLISFLLNITEVDPIKYDLLFERFLNKDRVTLPDIDIDIQDTRRIEVIEYLKEKYGSDRFATIVTFQNIGLKQSFKDCIRIFPENEKILNFLASQSNCETFDKLEENLCNLVEWNSLKRDMYHVYIILKSLIGFIRQSGTHASGVVFSDKKLNEIIPIKKNFDQINQTQIPMDQLSDFGLIKIDILGLKNLTIIQNILNKLNFNKSFLQSINLNDENVFKIFSNFDTLGIFQFESEGIKEVLRKIKPNSIETLAIASALYRPGPQNYIDTYVKNMKLNDSVEYLNEDVKKILKPTNNIIIYQEQIMRLLQIVGNFSLNRADTVRNGISKKDKLLIDNEKIEFLKNAKLNKYSDDQAEKLWSTIEEFANYGFNKSHAISYALISYWLAYFKTHYPGYFYAAQLDFISKSDKKFIDYIHEIKNKNINFKNFDIRHVTKNWEFKNEKIVIPLKIINGINSSQIEKFLKLDFNNLPIIDIVKKISKIEINEGTFKTLAELGAFDYLNYSRNQLVTFADNIFTLSQLDENMPFKKLTEYQDGKYYIEELELKHLGFNISETFFEIFRKKNKNINSILHLINNQGKFNIVAKIDNIKEFETKKKEKMCFLTIVDDTNKIELVIFAELYQSLKDVLAIGKIFIFNVKTQIYEGKTKYQLTNFKIREIILNKN